MQTASIDTQLDDQVLHSFRKIPELLKDLLVFNLAANLIFASFRTVHHAA